jgi:hypothetical protein
LFAGKAAEVLQQPAEQPRSPNFSFSVEELCSISEDWLTFDPLQQPFEQFVIPLDASFVAEACFSTVIEASDSLKQLPESIFLPFIEATSCLEFAEASGALQQPLEHASPLPALWRFPGLALDPPQEESEEARRTLREDSVEWRSLPTVERQDGAQQDSCPIDIKARQIQPRASSLAAYLARAERRCWSHGFPSVLLQLGPEISIV